MLLGRESSRFPDLTKNEGSAREPNETRKCPDGPATRAEGEGRGGGGERLCRAYPFISSPLGHAVMLQVSRYGRTHKIAKSRKDDASGEAICHRACVWTRGESKTGVNVIVEKSLGTGRGETRNTNSSALSL